MNWADIEKIAWAAVPVIFAITLHEAAHGYVARMCGDDTAQRLGRISINPLRHIDPIGTILVPIVLFLTTKFATGSGFIFGWAKPVPVNFGHLRDPKRDMFWVAAAGPFANLVMAFLWALALKLGQGAWEYATQFQWMCLVGLQTNLILMVLNLMPIPPLDGGRIVVSLLPSQLGWQFSRLEPFGFLIVIVLLLTNIMDVVLLPLVSVGSQWLLTIVGLH